MSEPVVTIKLQGSPPSGNTVRTQDVPLDPEAYQQAFDAANKDAWSPDQSTLNWVNTLVEQMVPTTVVQTGSPATGSTAMPVVEPAPSFGVVLVKGALLLGVGYMIFKFWKGK